MPRAAGRSRPATTVDHAHCVLGEADHLVFVRGEGEFAEVEVADRQQRPHIREQKRDRRPGRVRDRGKIAALGFERRPLDIFEVGTKQRRQRRQGAVATVEMARSASSSRSKCSSSVAVAGNIAASSRRASNSSSRASQRSANSAHCARIAANVRRRKS